MFTQKEQIWLKSLGNKSKEELLQEIKSDEKEAHILELQMFISKLYIQLQEKILENEKMKDRIEIMNGYF